MQRRFTARLRWDHAKALWMLVTFVAVAVPLYIWFFWGYLLCGTDTADPVYGETVCERSTRGLPYLALAASIVAVGGFVAIQRRNLPLFVFAALVPPVALGIYYAALFLA
jgi:hypothetical protein